MHLSSTAPVMLGRSLFPTASALLFDVHAGVEVGIVLTGMEERTFLDYTFQGSPGDVWLTGMWEPHGFRALQPNTQTAYIVFLPEFLGDELICERPWHDLLAVPPAQRPQVTTEVIRQAVLGIGEELRREREDEWRSGWETMARANLLRLLTLLRREWTTPPAALDDARGGVRNLMRIMPAIEAVKSLPTRRLPTQEAAALCSLSAAQFHRLFLQAMGVSFAHFSLRARLACVARMLAASSLPAETIARETGFTDASHMHRTFVKHYGRTPRQYREAS